MTAHEFVNRIRSLHCIEIEDLPGLDRERARKFMADPVRFTLRADEDALAIIWRAIEARQRPVVAPVVAEAMA